MDSSLDWDSIVFKKLSFCMSCITEDLVKDKFPMKLLEAPMDVLADIKSELQVKIPFFIFMAHIFVVVLGLRAIRFISNI